MRDVAYKCVKCETKGTAAKGTKIVALPYLLTVTLKRFDLNYEVPRPMKRWWLMADIGQLGRRWLA